LEGFVTVSVSVEFVLSATALGENDSVTVGATVAAATVVGSVAVSASDTVTPFVYVPAVLVAVTVNVIAFALVFAASDVVSVHVTVASVHVQPVPEIAVAVNPLGTVSTTEIVPLVAVAPLLVTVSVYVLPVLPAIKFPVCALATVRFAAAAAAKKFATSSDPHPVAWSYPAVTAYPASPPVSDVDDPAVLLLHIDGVAVEQVPTPELATVTSWNADAFVAASL